MMKAPVMDEHDIDAPDIDATVNCSACEAVCCRLPVLLMPEDRIPARFLDHDDRGLEIVAKAEDGWCEALDRDSLLCTIYAQRPTICRGFDMGGYDCRQERASWYGKTAVQIPIVVSNNTIIRPIKRPIKR